MENAESIEAFIALGSNLGDPREILRQAFDRLQELSQTPVRRSSLWRSAPVDCPPGSAEFLNAACALQPFADETPESLLAKLQALERDFGRRPKQVLNEPRPLDLDLIAFGCEVRNTPQLTLPHPRACERAFVVLPLSEVAPRAVLPGQVLSLQELARRLASTRAVQRLG
jgi:2-amino-4-hydroxy-6-hydroxymethyldihydropteridine diphosphokinase